ncbi:MAG TPA: DNA-directed RNA polymerase subunit beta', partial [Chitinophagales bacterium]|nr:DNA-directed RNA polymerase subunit beta' [Chitinophagales bacterium]
IGEITAIVGIARAAKFLDDIKDMGFRWAFRGGLSFSLKDLLVPSDKYDMIGEAKLEVEEVEGNYEMGLITNNERYNQVIDIWTRLSTRIKSKLIKGFETDRQGFNPVYMMFHSGARGSEQQILQLAGLRGLMAKPRKSGSSGPEIVENPILASFKEGLSVLEYFISTHGARKGLADTALKTADAGYLTRRLVDVAQDAIIAEEDCGTLRGIEISALKDNEEVIEPLYDRILGRVVLQDVVDPLTGELLIEAGGEISEDLARLIDQETGIETVEIRSVLTCESKRGVCVRCYGRNLANNRMAQIGDAVGIIAAQSIGEPGTQLTLRTFHTGGQASTIANESKLIAKFDGQIKFDFVRTASHTSKDGGEKITVIGRTGEIHIIDTDGRQLVSNNAPYGSILLVKDGDVVKKGDAICEWDPYNAVIVSEYAGTVSFDSIIDGITYREEADEQTGFREKVIIESKDKTK